MIQFGDYNNHWSYYLAIEEQLAATARFVEFSNDNLKVYSIEFARILLSAASETDVLLKQLCLLLDPTAKADSIRAYQKVISTYAPQMIDEHIYISRYNIELRPWEKLISDDSPPSWWTANNKVKHHRHTHFNDASLLNAIHSVGALHIIVIYYYKNIYENGLGDTISFGKVTDALTPRSGFYRMNSQYYSRVRGMNSAL